MKDKGIQLITVTVLLALVAASILAVMPDKAADHDLGNIAAELEISESVGYAWV